MKRILLAILALVSYCTSEACTSAAVSPMRSATGEVMLWKHRDSPRRETGVKYFEARDGRFAYIALVAKKGGGMYGGLNERGFGIISNTVKNLKVTDTEEAKALKKGYPLSSNALRYCTTVDDFERMIREHFPYQHGKNQMLAVCDAEGHAAWFEISQYELHRYDAQSDLLGLEFRSNFGFSGDKTQRGKSVMRYELMQKQFDEHKTTLSVTDFMNYSRSFMTVSGDELKREGKFFDPGNTVQRHTSCAEFVIVSGPNPRMFVSNGNPMVGMLIPVYVSPVIPECLKVDAEMISLSAEYLRKAYSKQSGGYLLNKELVRRIQRVRYDIFDPVEKPQDYAAYCMKMDARYHKHARKIKKILSRY